MKKLTPEDIQLKSPGQQAKQVILDKYYSVEYFAKAIDMGVPTVYQYLKRTDLGSDKFKYKFMKAFDISFNELILSNEGQIKKFVDTIFHDYTKYTSKTDFVTFKEVKTLCKKEKMESEIIKMERNEAMYYFKTKRTEQAIDMLKEIIEKAYEKKLYYHWVYFNCDLAVIYGYISNHKKAIQIHEGLQIDNFHRTKDEDFKDKALFKRYYHYGVMCNRVRKHNKAKTLFEKSLKYAWSDMYKGASLTGIGLSHKNNEDYDIALKYYFKALEVQPSIEKKIKIYNNIAEVYKQRKEYDKAMNYIEKVLRIIDWYEIKTNYMAYVTYLEIKFLKENADSALNELMNFTVKGKENNVSKSMLIFGLNTIIELAIKAKLYEILGKVEDVIMDTMDQTEEESFIEELKKSMGTIACFFYKENYKRRVLIDKQNL